jgi:hypothetical protein
MDTQSAKRGERERKTILHNSLLLCLSLKSHNFPIPFLFIFFSFISYSSIEPCAKDRVRERESGQREEENFMCDCVFKLNAGIVFVCTCINVPVHSFNGD